MEHLFQRSVTVDPVHFITLRRVDCIFQYSYLMAPQRHVDKLSRLGEGLTKDPSQHLIGVDGGTSSEPQVPPLPPTSQAHPHPPAVPLWPRRAPSRARPEPPAPALPPASHPNPHPLVFPAGTDSQHALGVHCANVDTRGQRSQRRALRVQNASRFVAVPTTAGRPSNRTSRSCRACHACAASHDSKDRALLVNLQIRRFSIEL